MKPSQKNAKTLHQTRVQQEPANARRVTETRATRTGVLHSLTRAIQMLSPQARRADKQERAAWESVDQHLGRVIDAAVSERLATAGMAGAKVTVALEAIGQKTDAQRSANAERCGLHVFRQVSSLSNDRLAALDAGLTELLKTPSDAVLQQLNVSVKAELLDRNMVAPNLQDNWAWWNRPLAFDIMDTAQLLQLKDLHDLASQLIGKAGKGTSDEAVVPGTRYTLRTLNNIREYGGLGLRQLIANANGSVSGATPKAMDVMDSEQLKELKTHVDVLVQIARGTPDTKLLTLQTDLIDRIQAGDTRIADQMLGTGVFDATALDPAKLVGLAGKIAALKDKPLRIAEAENAIKAEIAERKAKSKAEFQISLRTAVRSAATPHAEALGPEDDVAEASDSPVNIQPGDAQEATLVRLTEMLNQIARDLPETKTARALMTMKARVETVFLAVSKYEKKAEAEAEAERAVVHSKGATLRDSQAVAYTHADALEATLIAADAQDLIGQIDAKLTEVQKRQ